MVIPNGDKIFSVFKKCEKTSITYPIALRRLRTYRPIPAYVPRCHAINGTNPRLLHPRFVVAGCPHSALAKEGPKVFHAVICSGWSRNCRVFYSSCLEFLEAAKFLLEIPLDGTRGRTGREQFSFSFLILHRPAVRGSSRRTYSYGDLK